ncbi:hypothetical protein ACFYVR_18640 [Rhodococcus sp. NPDC003318]
MPPIESDELFVIAIDAGGDDRVLEAGDDVEVPGVVGGGDVAGP